MKCEECGRNFDGLAGSATAMMGAYHAHLDMHFLVDVLDSAIRSLGDPEDDDGDDEEEADPAKKPAA